MSVSRRHFLASVGAAGAASLTLPMIAWRGHESLFAQGNERKADRLLATRPGMIRIDSNENPNGPGERVYEAIRQHLSESNRYPVLAEDLLAEAIVKTHTAHGVKTENVILGCGSGELLRTAIYAFTGKDRALVAPEPTFEAPANFAKYLDHPVVTPRVNDKLVFDLDAMVDAASTAGLVYFCNPNNPTATAVGKDDVAAYIEKVNQRAPQATILVDEAYFEFVADPRYGTLIPVALQNPRVVVTRTFSKVFGMAGLRCGYAVGQPETLKKMSGWLLGSNVSQLTLMAAAATVGDTKHIASEVGKNRETRAFTKSFFEKAGYTVADTQANFLMADIKRDVKSFKAECVKHKVAIGRPFPALPSWARVSIGTMPEMKKALEVFKTTLA